MEIRTLPVQSHTKPAESALVMLRVVFPVMACVKLASYLGSGHEDFDTAVVADV